MVGVVVLGALVALGWMLIQFGASFVTPFAPRSLAIQFVTDRADGLSSGSGVLYRGVSVGRIDTIARAADQIHVYINASVDAEPPLPANVRAIIRSTGLIGGGASVVLELTDPTPQGKLSAQQKIDTRFVGLDILPPEFVDLATELRQTAKQFRESNVVAHLDEQVAKVGKVLDSIQSVVGDVQLRDDLKTSLASIRSTTDRANRIAENLETFSGDLHKLSGDTSKAIQTTQDQVLSISKQTSDRMGQLSRLLDQFQSIAEKVNKGQGTAGALVNDPKLYESLVDTSRELNATVSDLRRLVEQWEQEGVSLKLK